MPDINGHWVGAVEFDDYSDETIALRTIFRQVGTMMDGTLKIKINANDVGPIEIDGTCQGTVNGDAVSFVLINQWGQGFDYSGRFEGANRIRGTYVADESKRTRGSFLLTRLASPENKSVTHDQCELVV